MSLSRTAYSLIIGIGSVTILIFTKQLLIPFVLALLVWFLIRGIKKNGLEKVGFIRRFFPHWLQTTISALIIFGIVGAIVNMLIVNIELLSESLPTYEKNVKHIQELLDSNLKIDIAGMISEFIGDFDFSGILAAVFSSLTEIFGNAFTIVLYTLFLLLEDVMFPNKLKALYKDPKKYANANTILLKIEKSIGSYLYLKTLISLLTGFLSFIALWAIGVEAPVFWAFLIFLLNYIPTIGSLIATSFPSLFTLLQFGEWGPFFLVLGIVGTIQLIIGNIVEPKAMGNSLNISSLVVIIALSVWGVMWGITGMILSVPITVIIVIICAEFEKTRPIAILLSEKGSLKNFDEDPLED
jgi:predicted PurR-regulated permease PerM